MRRRARVILARFTFVDTSLNIFPQYGIYTGGHCCICIQSRCMHISPVSKLTSPPPLPPVHRLPCFDQPDKFLQFFFSLQLSNKFAKYPRFRDTPIFNPSEIFHKILLGRWEKLYRFLISLNYLIRSTNVKLIISCPIWSWTINQFPRAKYFCLFQSLHEFKQDISWK